jgi:hypothetical protein
MLTMPQSRHQELEKALETDLDQKARQIYGEATFDREYSTSVRTGGDLRAFCNQFTSSRIVVACFTSQFWWGDVCQR